MRVWILQKKQAAFVLICTAILTLSVLLGNHWRQSATQASSFHSLTDKVVVLDAGHGGPDPGSSGYGVLEKDVVLAITKKLGALLEKAGAQVYHIRKTDQDLSGMDRGSLSLRKQRDLIKRTELANEYKPDVFLSVHANAISSSRWFGAQTFYRVGEGAHPDNKRLAAMIQQELIAITGRTSRIPSTDIHQYILDHVQAPAATVEVGFLSNPDEARLLNRSDYQQKVAWAIFTGLARYFVEADSVDSIPAAGLLR